MVKIEPKESFAGSPPTVRATSYVMGPDPHNKTFLYCIGNGVVVRDIANPKNHEMYCEHAKRPTVAKYAPSRNYICSADESGGIRVWDTTQEEHMCKLERNMISGEIRDICWDGESKRIGICGAGKNSMAKVFSWDMATSLSEITELLKAANSIDIKQNRPYRCAVASEDAIAYYYNGPPFKKAKECTGASRFATCTRFSPNGELLVVASMDGNIYCYNGKTGEREEQFKFGNPAHATGVCSVCFSPDSMELLSASTDKTVKIWDVATRTTTVKFEMGTQLADQQVSCLWQGDYILSLSLSGDINYLDRHNPSQPLRVVVGHNKSITCVAVQPKEAIFTASFEGRIIKWNPTTGEGIRFKGTGHASKVTALLYDANDNRLISIGQDNNVRFTCAESCDFSTCTSVPLDTEPVSMSFAADGALVVACEKEIVMIRNGCKVATQEWQAIYPAKIAVAGGILFAPSPLERQSKYCDLYDIEANGFSKRDVRIDLSEMTAVAASSDGAMVAVAEQKSIYLYNIADGFEKSKKLYGHTGNVTSMAFSPNGQMLVSGQVGDFYAWDLATDKKQYAKRAHPLRTVTGLAWLDDHTVVSVGEDCAVKQWTVSL